MRALWLQVALAISVAFNIGLVMVFLLRPPMGHPHTAEEFLSRLKGHMPDRDFQTLAMVMTRASPEVLQKHADLDHAMDGLAAALAAEPFNDAALKKAMETVRISHGTSEQAFQDAVLEAAPSLSHEGRLALIPKPHSSPADRR